MVSLPLWSRNISQGELKISQAARVKEIFEFYNLIIRGRKNEKICITRAAPNGGQAS